MPENWMPEHEYERVSKRYDRLTDQSPPATESVEKTANHVAAAWMMASDGLKSGFQHVGKATGNTKHEIIFHPHR